MSGLELNKIAASILVAGLVATVTGAVTGALYYGGAKHAGHDEPKRGYTIEGVETAGDAGGAAAVDAGPVDILPYLATADMAKGQELVKRCTTCHTFEKGGPNRTGPNQWSLIGSDVAHKGDFNYSDAMKALHGQKKWGFQELSEFLANPKKYVPGNRMSYAGLKKPEERAALLVYLNSLSDAPLAIPKVEPKPEAEQPTPPEKGENPATSPPAPEAPKNDAKPAHP